METKEISPTFGVSDKVRILEGKQAFTSVKDHKADFFLQNHLSDWLPQQKQDIISHRILTNTRDLLRVATWIN